MGIFGVARYAGGRSTLVLLVAVSALGLSACSSNPSASKSSATGSIIASPNSTTPKEPTELPATCSTSASLAPVQPTPSWPSGAQILDAVPGSLATQYPTVFGGLIVAPATPGETPVQINSHFIVLEMVRDPALEAEVTSAYPPGLS